MLTSAARVTWWSLNLSNEMAVNVDPTSRRSFNEIPLAEVSNTTLSLVVELHSFLTACIGRYFWF